MEIKIPKEVRDYHETIFFGLNTRQFICSLLALGVAVGVYFLLRPLLGTEEIGWVCILAFPQLWNNLSAAQFGWLLAGGIIYTIGGVIYALKLSIFNDRHPCFGSHEIFHLFVMGGSLCHFIVMFLLV